MTRISSRNVVVAALTALTLGSGFAAAPAAAHPMGGFHGFHGFGGIGFGVAALATTAAIAASNSGCYLQQRNFIDPYGRVYSRYVRVCD